MGLRALGDSAWLFEAGGSNARAKLGLVLRVLGILRKNRIPEARDIVSSFDSVAVHFDPLDGGRVLEWLTALPAPEGGEEAWLEPRTLEVPVAYGGDLARIAEALGKTPDEIIALHCSADYTVAAVGFSPGFPYLLGLPEELRVPRAATPRPVEAGSVAIAGDQAGIYPFASQGGWNVLGRTGLRLFDPEREGPSHFRPGDQVRFVPVETCGFTEPKKPKVRLPAGGFEVLEPGAFTTVQDLGRHGFQHLGVSPGGAADPVAARVANRLLGNPDTAAVLECCMSGPILKFREDTRVAFTGWADARAGRPLEMPKGSVLDLQGRMPAVRGYLAVAGGIEVPRVMGSRATDVRAGFGGWLGRKLQVGDRLPIGPLVQGPLPGAWSVGWPQAETPGRMIELRFTAGMQASWFSEETRGRFRKSIYQISPVSDRMGARLDGPALALEEAREMVSQPVVAGSIQVPPDGRPIVLLAERQTIGGYPQIGHVISADVPKLARAWPGTRLRFREVSREEARDAWAAQESDFGFLQAGLELLR